MSEQVKLSAGSRADIRRDAERNCEGATVADTLRLLDDYDAMAQRCWELEAERNHFAIQAQRFYNERDALRAEVADLKARLLEAE